MDRVEEALRNPRASTLTAADVRGVAFNKPPIGRRGYNEDEVDAFLDRVEKELQQRR
ncbi:DivIVA domain-containing protein [Mycobacterium branderi]|uniref:DivIVA domain-containing protein n=1 Tax=Mycobacterium branderi TaxID=43348 RepID=UPI003556AEFE